MQFIDLAAQQRHIKDKIDANIQAVLAHGNYIMGPEVKRLEENLADYVGAKYAIGCASGTDALLMALMAFGIGPGDAVFTTPFTFISTAEVISLLGATPVFVDVDRKTFNIDPSKLRNVILSLRRNSGNYPLPKVPSKLVPKAIIPVDLFGLPADYDAIEAIAKEEGMSVIEDAAQSFGAEYKGRKTCSFGNIACTSFFPAKPLGCYGDGGMCFTDDDRLAETLRSICVHGKGSHKYDNIRIGINGRLDTLQAAILMAKFEIFPEEVELRQTRASHYNSILSTATFLDLPSVPFHYKSAWAQYSVVVKDRNNRDELMKKLQREGIPTAIYYPKPLHVQSAFAYLNYREGDFPESEDIARRIFSLPMHPYLSEADQEGIAQVLSDEG
jgi:dTDP-4-amino-4,6-dideoxygalactose transaminase